MKGWLIVLLFTGIVIVIGCCGLITLTEKEVVVKEYVCPDGRTVKNPTYCSEPEVSYRCRDGNRVVEDPSQCHVIESTTTSTQFKPTTTTIEEELEYTPQTTTSPQYTTTTRAYATPTKYPTTTQYSPPTTIPSQSLTTTRVKNLLLSIPGVDGIWAGSKFSIDIVDDSSKPHFFTITKTFSGFDVVPKLEDDVDFHISTDINDFKRLESSSDVCATLKQLKESNTTTFEVVTMMARVKYASLLVCITP